jgi:hypothetical protein
MNVVILMNMNTRMTDKNPRRPDLESGAWHVTFIITTGFQSQATSRE